MVTIQGIARSEGVAIAVAAVVDATNGINGVSPALLDEGLRAIRARLLPHDYPEAVVVCDSPAMGTTIRIPGVNVIGIATQSDTDMPGLIVEMPCAIGLEGLLESVSEGDIVIIDGGKGIVYIDPDPATLIHYQELDERKATARRLFIASEHIPARTQAGETILVYALVAEEAELTRALEDGADGLVVDLREHVGDPTAYCDNVLRAAAGKQVVFLITEYAEEVLRSAMWLAASGQVTLACSPAASDQVLREIESLLSAIESDSEATSVNIGTILLEPGHAADEVGECRIVLDVRESPLLSGIASPELKCVTVAPDQSDALVHLIEMGAKCVAVAPDAIGSAKYTIRSMGMEEVD